MKAVDLRILGLLHIMGGSAYGLDLMIHGSMKSSTVYPSLERLESLGWVQSDWEEAPIGNPRRRYRLAA